MQPSRNTIQKKLVHEALLRLNNHPTAEEIFAEVGSVYTQISRGTVYRILNQLAEQGMAIIMISSELPEIINMSDRVIVMRSGEISAVLEREDLSQEKIMGYAVNI